jgi:hypothetical protein
MYPSHQWPRPGPVYDYPSPTPAPRANKIALIVAIVVTAIVGWAVFLGVVYPYLSAPSFTVDEQGYLKSVHAFRPEALLIPDDPRWAPKWRRAAQQYNKGLEFKPWPSDSELVREGHEACAHMDSSGGNDQFAESFLDYPELQSADVVGFAINYFCPGWNA